MAPGRFLTSPPAVPLNSLDLTYDGEGKRRSIDLGAGSLAGFKCATAGYVVMQELSSVAIAGTASGAFVFGGEFAPVGNGILSGVAAASGANAAYNFAFTDQAVRWCLGGASPTAPSTMFLPPNFPWRFVAP